MEKNVELHPEEQTTLVELLTSGEQLRPSAYASREWLATVQARQARLPSHSGWRWAAVAGWAIAGGLALFTLKQRPLSTQISQTSIPSPTPPKVAVPPKATHAPQAEPKLTKTALVQEMERLRREVAALRAATKTARPATNGENRFTIFELSQKAPGKKISQPTEFSSQRLAKYLQRGIENELDAARLAQPTQGQAIVGPEYGTWDEKLNASVLVYPNFPQNEWESHGLLRAQGGVYYDPQRGLLWQPSPEAYGTWKGVPVERSDWLVDSLQGHPYPETAASTQTSADPTLLVTMDQQTGEGTLLTENLPALSDNEVYVVGLNDATTNRTLRVGTLAPGLSGNLSVSFSTLDTGLNVDGVSVFPVNLNSIVQNGESLTLGPPSNAYSSGFVPTAPTVPQ